MAAVKIFTKLNYPQYNIELEFISQTDKKIIPATNQRVLFPAKKIIPRLKITKKMFKRRSGRPLRLNSASIVKGR